MDDLGSVSVQRSLPSFEAPRGWLVAEPTRLLDRAVPKLQEFWMPLARTVAGEFSLEVESGTSRPQAQGRVAALKSLATRLTNRGAATNDVVEALDDTLIIDLRRRAPQNWAHATTNHLPLSLLIQSELGRPKSAFTVVFPAQISKRIVEVYELVGFNAVTTDNPVRGTLCQYTLEPWIGSRGERHAIAKAGLADTELFARVAEATIPAERLYVSRKDQRKLGNEAEVARYLEGRGYTRVYPEDFSAVEQLAMMTKATDFVAVHGAGLGPLLLRNALGGTAPYKLTEIFSPAHITDVYRVIAAQTGGTWTGVRGNVWPSLLTPLANFRNNLSDFDVSMDALRHVMETLER